MTNDKIRNGNFVFHLNMEGELMMVPRIEIIKEKKLVGKRLVMSLANNRTGELWKSFMPDRNSIGNRLTPDLISMGVYPQDYFSEFNPGREFEKWAAVEVSDFQEIPQGMETFVLPGGLYAVFHYIGLNADNSVFQYIFGDWLPNSQFNLDDRPHFEVLGEKYRNNDPASEEEIWVPVTNK